MPKDPEGLPVVTPTEICQTRANTGSKPSKAEARNGHTVEPFRVGLPLFVRRAPLWKGGTGASGALRARRLRVGSDAGVI